MEEKVCIVIQPIESSRIRYWIIWLILSIIHFFISTAYTFSEPFRKSFQHIVIRIPFIDGIYYTEWILFLGNTQLLICILYLILWLIMIILDSSGRICHTCCCLCANCKSIDDDSDEEKGKKFQ